MKAPIFLLLGLLLLAGALASVSLPPVVVGYLEPNLTLSAQALNTEQGTAYLISIGGKETLMANDWSNALVSDPTQMAALLRDDIQRSSGFEDALVTLNNDIIDLQAQRVHPEKQCALLTGTDHLPCLDRESCVVAAHGNPQADVMVEADGFWQAMRDEVVTRGNLNLSVQQLILANDTATANAASARAISSDMSDTAAKVSALYTNDLFLNHTDAQCQGSAGSHCFEYCPKIAWTADGSGWNTLQARFAAIAANLDSLSAQDARAAAIANAQAQWVNYSKNRGALWQQMKSALQAKQGTLDGKLSNTSASARLWSDVTLQSDYQTWKTQFERVQAQAFVGQFYQALQVKASMMAQADNISARADANDRAVASIRSNLASIDKSITALQAAHANATDLAGLSQSQAQLKSSIDYPIPASQLPGLLDQSSRLGQLVLAEVGQVTLGVPPVTSNVSGQASGIVGTGGAGAQGGANASAGAGAPPNSSSPLSQLKAAGCPLAIGLAGLALVLALGVARLGKED